MSASLKQEIARQVERDLSAVLEVLRALSESLTKLELRVKALEETQHGNRQRRAPRSN